jgi:hypothetical protein
VQYDHTSILKHIENMFGLEPLTARDAAANDLSDAIDADRIAANQPASPIELPVVDIDPDTIDPACKTMVPNYHPTDLAVWADKGNIPAIYDLRPRRRETAFYIANYLERHGLGGFHKR